MPAHETLTLELLSNDGTTIQWRATVVNAPKHPPLVAIKEISLDPTGAGETFTYYAGLPTLLADGDSTEFSAPAPTDGWAGEAFLWAWPDVSPISNVVSL